MGDDAELWIESGGDPTTLIKDYYCDDIYEKTIQQKKKRNTMLFIDAESVSANHCSRIIGQCTKVGEIYESRYYALQKDHSTAAWKKAAKQYDIKPILLYGNPTHNKVDYKIVKDIKCILDNNPSIDIFCIASRDGDFSEVVQYIRKKKKRVVILATKDTSNKLKAKASEVRGI